ncbi:hypothetical protein ACRAVF_26735 [Bradyrhizobium oligotrophicum S58]
MAEEIDELMVVLSVGRVRSKTDASAYDEDNFLKALEHNAQPLRRAAG